MSREKFAYDLSLICVSQAMKDYSPSNNNDAINFALKCFAKTYDTILHSSDPAFEIVDTIPTDN